MHTSVEKHSLRIAESCGTLAHASRFSFSGSAIWIGNRRVLLMRAPYFYSVQRRAAVFARRWSEPCSTIVCNRLMGFSHPKLFKDSC
jgi:hypothetical protein